MRTDLHPARWFAAFLAFFAASSVAAGEPADLALTDLPEYRVALEGQPDEPAVGVTFRQLWDQPEHFRNHRVRVEGRLIRRFRQPALGTFPALAEAWAVSPAGDPFCFVSPDTSREIALGSLVAFEGTFLRQVAYKGSDAARLAPLIVGKEGPRVVAPPREADETSPVGEPIGWLWGVVGLTAAAILGLALARRHLTARPERRPRRRDDDGPPPEFVDPEYNPGDGHGGDASA